MFEGLFQPMHLSIICRHRSTNFRPKETARVGKRPGRRDPCFKSAMNPEKPEPAKEAEATRTA
jgi:hypothetical protein